ncbi:MAG: hypothetical protein HC781_08650 [Leptolyngbyaceae cyanobacterium CSU_1_4]|nr:hypothetical protein [Leptolyngbyaceae cyanobacterium CSU_1_4]
MNRIGWSGLQPRYTVAPSILTISPIWLSHADAHVLAVSKWGRNNRRKLQPIASNLFHIKLVHPGNTWSRSPSIHTRTRSPWATGSSSLSSEVSEICK